MPQGVETDNWRIAAEGDDAYLLVVSGTAGEYGCIGRVLDLTQGILFPEFPYDSLLARGYWNEYTGPQTALPGLLKKVRRIDRAQDL